MTCYFDAVHELVGGQIGGPTHGPVSKYRFHDGQTPPTEEEIQKKLAELQAEYDANQYQRDREVQYPSIQEQLDMQYWDSVNGTTTWKDTIAKVKSDNSKPSE